MKRTLVFVLLTFTFVISLPNATISTHAETNMTAFIQYCIEQARAADDIDYKSLSAFLKIKNMIDGGSDVKKVGETCEDEARHYWKEWEDVEKALDGLTGTVEEFRKATGSE